MSTVSNFIKISEDYDLSPSKLAIAWCLLNKNVSTVILGASNTDQLKDNLAALNYSEHLKDDELIQKLNNI
jgi:aryl-alcohol dehydrogenase-like predicted oxidoreductase